MRKRKPVVESNVRVTMTRTAYKELLKALNTRSKKAVCDYLNKVGHYMGTVVDITTDD